MRLYAYYRSSASYRVRLGLHHKNLAFEAVTVSILDGANREAEHLARNPLGQVPVLEFEREGRTVWLAQSLAILEYLDETYPANPLLPQDPIARARVRELAEIVNSGTQPLQNTPVLADIRALGGDADAWGRKYVRKGLLALAARAKETHGAFLVGDAPSLADVCLVPQMYNARRFDISFEGLELLVAIDERCRALPRWDLARPEVQPDAPKE
jgi:maleylpyruvate isomerase